MADMPLIWRHRLSLYELLLANYQQELAASTPSMTSVLLEDEMRKIEYKILDLKKERPDPV